MQDFIPSREEVAEVQEFISRLKSKLLNFYRENGLKVEVFDVGSTAKGTFVRGDFDVDVYVLTDDPDRAYMLGRHLFPQGKRKYGELLIWHFIANHFDVDLVFARKGYVKEDTLKHPEFYRKMLSPKMKNEVIKGKAYFKTKGVYGAEVGGITGVAVEELVRQHNTFDNVCRFLVESKEKPFLQDPVMHKPRDLLASVTPKRWKQIQHACREYLATRKVTYKPFREEDFRSRYKNYAILQFTRRRDRAVDFFTAQSIAFHVARMLKNLEGEVNFEYDVYVGKDKVLIALKAYPQRLSETKEVCMNKQFEKAVKNFIETHPDAYQKGIYICARVPRKFTEPLKTYVDEVEKRMRERGYKTVWAKFYGDLI